MCCYIHNTFSWLPKKLWVHFSCSLQMHHCYISNIFLHTKHLCCWQSHHRTNNVMERLDGYFKKHGWGSVWWKFSITMMGTIGGGCVNAISFFNNVVYISFGPHYHLFCVIFVTYEMLLYLKHFVLQQRFMEKIVRVGQRRVFFWLYMSVLRLFICLSS